MTSPDERGEVGEPPTRTTSTCARRQQQLHWGRGVMPGRATTTLVQAVPECFSIRKRRLSSPAPQQVVPLAGRALSSWIPSFARPRAPPRRAVSSPGAMLAAIHRRRVPALLASQNARDASVSLGSGTRPRQAES